MTEKDVDVLIPCFNGSSHVRATLDSVLSQRYDRYNVIVINDGSTDSTSAILDEYGSAITVLSHADMCNHGQAASLNLGLTNSRSKFVAFLDSDDIWHSNKLCRLVKFLELNQEVSLVYTNGYVIDSEGRELYPIYPDDHHEKNEPKDLLIDCYIRTPSQVMVRREVFRKAGYFKQGIIPADHDMWLRIKECANICYLNEFLIDYRQHPAQMSSSRSVAMWNDGFHVLADAMKRYNYPANIRRKRLAVLHYRLGECSLRRNSIFLACWYDPVRSLKTLNHVMR